MRKNKLLYIIWLCVSWGAFSQSAIQNPPARASLDDQPKSGRSSFHLYINRFKIGIVAGYFNAPQHTHTLKPLNFTYSVYFPYEYILKSASRRNVFKISPTAIIHHSMYGNYGIGIGAKLSVLLAQKTHLSYQLGLAWFEVNNSNAEDGLSSSKGLYFHHNVSLSYDVSKHVEASLHALRVSSGFIGSQNGKNEQNVVGIGIAYHVL